MNIRYQENPSAWRKSTLLTVLGLAILSGLLRWRHVLSTGQWLVVLAVLGGAALLAALRPRWFRGYYRFSTWAGVWSSQYVARVFLALLFFLVLTPAACLMRLLGKDSLRLKRSEKTESYWTPAKQGGSLDRLF
jgi:hypothetical protein